MNSTNAHWNQPAADKDETLAQHTNNDFDSWNYSTTPLLWFFSSSGDLSSRFKLTCPTEQNSFNRKDPCLEATMTLSSPSIA